LNAPTDEQLAETLISAIHAADPLVDDHGWIRAEVDLPPGRDPDRPTRLHRPADSDNPDYIPGRRFDPGIGNDQARAACEVAEMKAPDAHRLATVAVKAMHEIRGRTPRRVRLPRRFGFSETVYSTARRLQWLLDDGITDVDDLEVRKTAHAAAVQLLLAHAALQGVLADFDGTGELPASRRCDNPLGCDMPPRPGGKKCGACAQMWLRKRRHRVPRRYSDAREAKVRRVERGEDRAASPFPAGRYVDGEWVPATPHPDAPPHREAS
jgi:hypothetical protein